MTDEETVELTVTVNGADVSRPVPVRRLLSDFLRHDLGLTGTHVGCEHGVCGCCTVLVDGVAMRSCLLLAVQVDGGSVRTIEGLSSEGEPLHPVQQAFQESHALQCGFCTPGFVMSVCAVLEDDARADPLTDDEIREAISGNLCRCTGYQHIVDAVRLADSRMRSPADAGAAPSEPNA
jgi:aerobic carbon-monoxide dehydrogenase small subunit